MTHCVVWSDSGEHLLHNPRLVCSALSLMSVGQAQKSTWRPKTVALHGLFVLLSGLVPIGIHNGVIGTKRNVAAIVFWGMV